MNQLIIVFLKLQNNFPCNLESYLKIVVLPVDYYIQSIDHKIFVTALLFVFFLTEVRGFL